MYLFRCEYQHHASNFVQISLQHVYVINFVTLLMLKLAKIV